MPAVCSIALRSCIPMTHGAYGTGPGTMAPYPTGRWGAQGATVMLDENGNAVPVPKGTDAQRQQILSAVAECRLTGEARKLS